MDYSAPSMQEYVFLPPGNNILVDDYSDIHAAYMENIDPLLRQDSLQRYLQEPDMLFLTNTFVQSFPNQQMPQGFPRHCETVPSFPILPSQSYSKERMNSPSPSHGLSDSCSSARSPADEYDPYQEIFQPQQLPNTYSPTNTSTTMMPSLSPTMFSNSCVSMSEIQEIPGAQEFVYQDDYIEEQKEESIEDHHSLEFGFSIDKYTPSDSALGSSIHGASPPQSSRYHQVEAEADSRPEGNEDLEIDAEGEDEVIVVDTGAEEDTINTWADEDPDDDTDYSPKPSRNNKRKASTPVSPAAKRGRIMNKKSASKANLGCKSCQQTFATPSALQRHVVSEHTRAFSCIFCFAGCPSTFASKNEWKRHVSSQHLNLVYWRCTQGACGRANTSKSQGVFNRKDLFTQHMRRMHAPLPVKRQQKKDAHWEARLKCLQESCMKTRGSPPAKLGCPVQGCSHEFAGSSCWDDRMEHIGKHLEKVVTGRADEDEEIVIRNENDELLVDWALRQGIIERKGNEYTLCSKDKIDIDADGEAF